MLLDFDKLGGLRLFLVGLTMLVCLFLILPIVFIAALSFGSSQWLIFPPPSWTFKWYQDLFADPQHPYTIGLLGSIPRIDVDRKRLATIEGTVPSPNNQPAGCRFAPRCPFADQRCRLDPPPLRDIAPGHRVACWKAPVEVAS